MTDSELGGERDNYCYRHPKRQSFVLCQRCGRTICPDCQTQAAVGVQCPECVREGRATVARTPITKQAARAFRPRAGAPIVTYVLIAICVVVFILESVLGDAFKVQLVYYGPFALTEPWRVLTSSVAHANLLHLALNGYSLYIMGVSLEPLLGRVRFLLLFLLTAFGGCVAVLLLAPATPVLGASGAIFGMFGALFIILRRLGANATQLLIVIVLNLVLSFTISGVSWQGHVGGLAVGLAMGAIFARTRGPRQKRLQVLLLAGIAVALSVLTVVGVVFMPPVLG